MRQPNGTADRVSALDPKSKLRWRRWTIEGHVAGWNAAQFDAAFELLALQKEFDSLHGSSRLALAGQLHELRSVLGLYGAPASPRDERAAEERDRLEHGVLA